MVRITHHVYKEVNRAYNNILFTPPRIGDMNQQMKRLYEAASERRGIRGHCRKKAGRNAATGNGNAERSSSGRSRTPRPDRHKLQIGKSLQVDPLRRVFFSSVVRVFTKLLNIVFDIYLNMVCNIKTVNQDDQGQAIRGRS